MKKLLLLFTLLLLCTPLIKAADIVETFESFTDAKKNMVTIFRKHIRYRMYVHNNQSEMERF